MTKHLYQTLQKGLLLSTLLVIVSVFYSQYVGGFQPCPLCLMQRFCAFILVVIFLIGVCQSTLVSAKILSCFQMTGAILGLFFAFRQLWLQHLPIGQAPACIPDLSVLIHYFPWTDVMHALFWGAGDCSEVTWKWLGLSMATWSALYFLIILVVGGYIFYQLGQPVIGVKKKLK